MPLDVHLIRGDVAWPSEAELAFRHGVQGLEDHLLGIGFGQAELDVLSRRTQEGSDLHAVLKVGADRLDANCIDTDLAYGVTRVLEQLIELASRERLLVDDGRGPFTHLDAPWQDLLDTVVAMATRLVTEAVDAGDLPAGVIDPQDVADDALVDLLEDRDRSIQAVRRHVRTRLERRMARWRDRLADLPLDAPTSQFGEDGEPYTGEDLFDPNASHQVRPRQR